MINITSILGVLCKEGLFEDCPVWKNCFINETTITNCKNIQMTGQYMSGTIPSKISMLTNLEYFAVGGNHYRISGTMPSLKGLTNLIYMDVDTNSISGTIPSDGWSDMNKLTLLDFAFNRFSGTFPGDQIGKLSSLQRLYINGWAPSFGPHSNMSISGTLPGSMSSFWQLSNLKEFGADGNFISGSVPNEVANLTNLEYFSVNHNRLSSAGVGLCIAAKHLSAGCRLTQNDNTWGNCEDCPVCLNHGPCDDLPYPCCSNI